MTPTRISWRCYIRWYPRRGARRECKCKICFIGDSEWQGQNHDQQGYCSKKSVSLWIPLPLAFKLSFSFQLYYCCVLMGNRSFTLFHRLLEIIVASLLPAGHNCVTGIHFAPLQRLQFDEKEKGSIVTEITLAEITPQSNGLFRMNQFSSNAWSCSNLCWRLWTHQRERQRRRWYCDECWPLC